MTDQAQLLPGTLDLLILKAVSLGPLHGYGVLLRIHQITGQALLVEQGALYPALFRLLRQGLLKAKWGVSENNRRGEFYEVTGAGQKGVRAGAGGLAVRAARRRPRAAALARRLGREVRGPQRGALEARSPRARPAWRRARTAAARAACRRRRSCSGRRSCGAAP